MDKVLKGAAIALGLSGLSLLMFYSWATASGYPIRRYAEMFSYGDPLTIPASDTFTVVSYNIGYLSGLTNNVAVNRSADLFEANLQQAIQTLQGLGADLIALQEIDLAAKRSYDVNQVDALATALDLPVGAVNINWDKNYVPFPYWPPTAHFGRILSGQAVLSRYPIARNDRIVLEKVASRPFFYNALYLDRLAQVTEVQLGDRSLILINLHLEAFDNPTRLAQTQVVKDLAERYAQDYPVLLVGDFNSAVNRPEEGEIKTIEVLAESSLLTPAIALARHSDADQATFPADAPQHKLDYIFYTPATLEMLTARVVTEAGPASDHLPIAMTFRLKGE
ncbi:MAG: endonuclease/exonuclease/phosphatase family protein [Cyanobacteria bacterium P01_A01_bin.105]